MIVLKILDLKKFMSAFLVRDLLDDYSLIEGQVKTFCTWSVDGRLERTFFENKTAAGSAVPDNAAESASSVNHKASGTPAEKSAPVIYVRWSAVKPHIYNLMRGKRTPLFFKFVFFYPAEQLAQFLAARGIRPDTAGISGLCINLRYDGTGLLLTTGISRSGFSLDRSADEAWDAYAREFLTQQEIGFEDI